MYVTDIRGAAVLLACLSGNNYKLRPISNRNIRCAIFARRSNHPIYGSLVFGTMGVTNPRGVAFVYRINKCASFVESIRSRLPVL